MALTVLLDLRLKPEALTGAPAMLRDILAGTRAFAGCLGVDVLVDSVDPAHVILMERWESVEADAAYREWRAGDGATELGSLLAVAPQLSMFETASDI
ncbi:putative quinol monooxygenase [Cryobacterium psychrophilum]|uniref:Antibiotic biosynthesis monooxygenase n=1 Tax=Cryobacterium psychrophilum TaxID=41988 RepID=A0A4Y8KME1_9MICO|nr:antibiotic biosynthesis monooxygenase family protein [Cryobacterium psychrophilum]TDW30317.1 antibiotic biosynthesis monooxygenase [Cryobacterium psychrophilum]TFD77530.1 antibiotic biosynthesis monooxygenase [Cryobacterium psychrophilum]